MKKTFARPLAVAVVAAGLAGCALIPPTDTAHDTSAPPATPAASGELAPAQEAAVDQALSSGDEDEDVVDPPADQPSDDWMLSVPERPTPIDFTVRPEPPTPLVEYLPASSVLSIDPGGYDPGYMELLSKPDFQSAVFVAQIMLTGTAEMVNYSTADYFAPVVASTCRYCLSKLHTASVLHDGTAVADGPWELLHDTKADVTELSSTEHISVEILGAENMHVYTDGNQTYMGDAPGEKLFHLEMLFDQGQWWVLGVSSEPV